MYKSEIFSTSRDGFSKAGVYCTLSICCEQLESEREVDVFNAVRLVKQNRPQLVPTLVSMLYPVLALVNIRFTVQYHFMSTSTLVSNCIKLVKKSFSMSILFCNVGCSHKVKFSYCYHMYTMVRSFVHSVPTERMCTMFTL